MGKLAIIILCVLGFLGAVQANNDEEIVFKRAKLSIAKATGDFDVVNIMEPRIELVLFSDDKENLDRGIYRKFILVIDGQKYDFAVSSIWQDRCRVMHFMAIPEDVIGGSLLTGHSLALMDQAGSICIKPDENHIKANLIRRENGMILGTQSMQGGFLPTFGVGPVNL